MRNDAFNIRLRLPEYQGRQIHEMALKENRSQSSAISILVSEALAARRSAASQIAEVSKLVSAIRSEASDFPVT
jgi:type II secretory pathway component PulM